jgi:hypothetical protein
MMMLQEDDTCKYYFALLTGGLGLAVVEKKMRADGVAEATIDMFMLVGKTMVKEGQQEGMHVGGGGAAGSRGAMGGVHDAEEASDRYPVAAKCVSSGFAKPKARKQGTKVAKGSKGRSRKIEIGDDMVLLAGQAVSTYTSQASNCYLNDEQNAVYGCSLRESRESAGGHRSTRIFDKEEWQKAQTAPDPDDDGNVDGYASIACLLSSNSDLSAIQDAVWNRWYERANLGQPVTIKVSSLRSEVISDLYKAHELIQIYTNTDCYFVAFCTWILTTST